MWWERKEETLPHFLSRMLRMMEGKSQGERKRGTLLSSQEDEGASLAGRGERREKLVHRPLSRLLWMTRKERTWREKREKEKEVYRGTPQKRGPNFP